MVKRILIAAVVIAALGGAGWWAWVTYGDRIGEPETALGGSGTLEAEQVAVSSMIPGRITTISVEPGKQVTAGEVLFELDAQLMQLQVRQAEAGVRVAQAALDQAKTDQVSKALLDQAQARLDQAKAALDMAKVQAGYAAIAAPVDGHVTLVAASVGENASPGRTLATIADLSRLYVNIYVPETDIAQLQVGVRATVSTDSSAETFEATVIRIASQAEFTPSSVETREQRAKLVYEVRLEVRDRAGALKPGMPVNVTF